MPQSSGLSKTSTPRMVGAAALTVAAAFVSMDRLVADLTGLSLWVDQLIEAAALGAVAAAVLWIAVIRPLRREADRERAATAEREDRLRLEADRQEFQARLHRALEMAATEDAAYRATTKALTRGVGHLDAEVLLADSSDAHLKRAVVVGGDAGLARCGVASPRDCPAIRRAQTLQFASSDELDACPHLEGRPGGSCAAVCVPISVGGRSIGVLHAATDPASPATAGDLGRLEAVATQAGSRIGMLRVMAATHLQAATDPLTGLLNRRSFENQVHELLRVNRPFALAMGDLDHFKALNDTAGHDAGDRALRLFARTVRTILRADDLVCRFGGEEFAIVFPGCTATEAADALHRVQEQLIVSLAGGAVPGFTASFGVAHTSDASSLDELCRVADSALFRAKREGRNRVIVDSPAEQDHVA
jgi:diguanylate cyclase (GGDEF)-like protein